MKKWEMKRNEKKRKEMAISCTNEVLLPLIVHITKTMIVVFCKKINTLLILPHFIIKILCHQVLLLVFQILHVGTISARLINVWQACTCSGSQLNDNDKNDNQ